MTVPILTSRNLELTKVIENKSLASDFKTDIIDFKEMNSAFIQANVAGPDAYDGKFSLVVSLLCDASTFVPYPDSEREMGADCLNSGWSFCCVPFRYARVCYTNGTLTTGTVSIYARAKRT